MNKLATIFSPDRQILAYSLFDDREFCQTHLLWKTPEEAWEKYGKDPRPKCNHGGEPCTVFVDENHVEWIARICLK